MNEERVRIGALREAIALLGVHCIWSGIDCREVTLSHLTAFGTYAPPFSAI